MLYSIKEESMKRHTILVVDDSRTNLQVVRDVLENDYGLQLAVSGEMALKFVSRRKPDLILLDLMMPVMDGIETYTRIRQDPENAGIPVIFLTASQNAEVEVECLKIGASDFITKPIVPEVLESRIRKTLELEDLQKNLQEKIEEKTLEIETLALQTIGAIVHTIEARDVVTQGHSVRVAGYSRAVARAMGYSEQKAERVYQIALLHDVGKIGIPDAILKKTGELTAEEYNKIKEHTTIGAGILSSITTISYLPEGARYHHERYDGKGYPQGLKGKEIPEIGRIIAVADVYDALVSTRQYKPPMEDMDAEEIMRRGSGTQFDPDILRVFLRLMKSGEIDRIRESYREDPGDEVKNEVKQMLVG